MTDSTGTTTYTYNGFGELTSEQKGNILKTYSYDNMGNVTAFTLKDGDETLLTQSYTYDNLNRLSTFAQGGDTVAYTYDNNSNLLTTTINGSLHETNQYNNANLPISKTSYVSANNPEVNTYSYYLNGNLASRTKDADTQGTDLSYAYTYNNGGQFIQETITGNNVNLQNSYIYDNYGNIKKETIRDINESTARYSINTYNSANQLVSRVLKENGETINYTYTYDDAGNMLTESKDGVVQKTYTYDKFDRLATYTAGDTTAQYTYNGDNLRQSKTVNNVTTQHIYNGANIVADVCGDNTQLYIRGNSLHFNKALGTSDKQIYILTPKGDVSKIINADGTYEHFEYIPYGEISEGELQANNPFGYCGEYTDLSSGLIYLRNRYYDPSIGRFITEDPARDGLNWYVYCRNNPIRYIDPTGLFRIIDGNSYDKYQLGSGNINNQINDYVSEDIKKMQIKLQELGYLDKSITWYGYFGNQTLAAVNAFKEANNIQNNTKETKGIVGATTWALMGLDFDVIESVGLTSSNVSMNRGVLRVDRNIVNANMVNTYYAAGAIKDTYKVAFGEEFNVTTDSVYWELVGHIFADEVAETNKGGMLDPLWKRVQRSTGTIDIGDDVIVPDNNRWVWDLISRLGVNKE